MPETILCPVDRCPWTLDATAPQVPDTALAAVFGAGVFAQVAANQHAGRLEEELERHLNDHAPVDFVRTITALRRDRDEWIRRSGDAAPGWASSAALQEAYGYVLDQWQQAEAEVTRLRALADDPTTNPYWRLRAEQAEAANQRVRELRQRYGAMVVPLDGQFNAGRMATLMDVLDDLDAALDSTQPDTPAPGPHDWQRTNPVGSLQCVRCGLYACCDSGDGCRSDSGLPVDGEERK